MFGVNVDISRFREFGCPAWVFIPPGMRSPGKLALRSVKGRFVGLGMPLGSPAYLVQLDNRVIQTSDVTFTELQSLAHVSGELPLDSESLSAPPVTTLILVSQVFMSRFFLFSLLVLSFRLILPCRRIVLVLACAFLSMKVLSISLPCHVSLLDQLVAPNLLPTSHAKMMNWGTHLPLLIRIHQLFR